MDLIDKKNFLDKETNTPIDTTSFKKYSTELLQVSGGIIFVSLIGLIGACCANRFFLFIYEIFLVLLFFIHLLIVILVVFGTQTVVEDLNKKLLSSVVS